MSIESLRVVAFLSTVESVNKYKDDLCYLRRVGCDLARISFTLQLALLDGKDDENVMHSLTLNV